jgi:dihydropteroate synthase/dihydroneopterin aldolase/2-amino-4-hydroxy-6-hydroxymethyldihydropteridine diphosphokinase
VTARDRLARLDEWLAPGRETLVMGVVNVTPDSFSDPGRWLSPAAAVAHSLELVRQGAAVIDVGGESTRPGSVPVAAAEQLARIIPVIEALAAQDVIVSVDTMDAAVAVAAVAAGAVIVNDVSGGLADPGMLPAVAGCQAAYIASHWLGWLGPDGSPTLYQDVVAEVRQALADRIEACRAAGVAPGRLILDPGIGFSKSAADNWRLVAGAARLHDLGQPVLWGVSRKRFTGPDQTVAQRDAAAVALSVWLAGQGAWGVRVHQVAEHRTALAVGHQLATHAAGCPDSPTGRPDSPTGRPDSAPTRAMAPASFPSPPGASRAAAAGGADGAGGGDRLDGEARGEWGEGAALSGGWPQGSDCRIELRGLKAWGRHGVLAQEKVEAQPFQVDLTAWPPVAPRPDDLAATVDYGRLAGEAVAVVEGPSCDLIETVADRIARRSLDLGGLADVAVTVHKPAAPLPQAFQDVAVTVRRRAGGRRRRAVCSLGSNLDDRLGWLQFGLTGLATTEGLELLAVSGVYQSAPVGLSGQDDYLNVIALVVTDWPAGAMLERGLELERLAGRRRPPVWPMPPGESDWRPQDHPARRLDIDLISWGPVAPASGPAAAREVLTEAIWEAPAEERIDSLRLRLPHPRAAQRAFVLRPWLEVEPQARLDGRPLADWLARIEGQPIHRRDDLSLLVPESNAPASPARRDDPTAGDRTRLDFSAGGGTRLEPSPDGWTAGLRPGTG